MLEDLQEADQEAIDLFSSYSSHLAKVLIYTKKENIITKYNFGGIHKYTTHGQILTNNFMKNLQLKRIYLAKFIMNLKRSQPLEMYTV